MPAARAVGAVARRAVARDGMWITARTSLSLHVALAVAVGAQVSVAWPAVVWVGGL